MPILRLLDRVAIAIAIAVSSGSMPVTAHAAEENTGKVSQPLVGGQVIDAQTQERYTLLTLSSGCSASLLRNEWVVTAAHCVDDPDPDRSGEFITVPDTSVTVTANWPSTQQRRSLRIITFRPYDVAIIRVDAPFNVLGSTRGFSRLVFQDGQFPYFGTPVGAPITVFGRGIHQFAQGSGAGATPSRGDGQYRVGFFRPTHDSDDGRLYWYPSSAGQAIAGGDSGGPSFATVLSGEALVGVHALCTSRCLAGQTCPAGSWMWVSETPECADAPIAPLLDDMGRYMGTRVAEPPAPGQDDLREPLPSGFIGTFGTTPANYQPIWVYAIKDDGDLLWYRKDTGTAPWQGPKKIGNGWKFKDVIAAGGNSVYALTQDGVLKWYQHQGFNDGSFTWNGPVDVARGLNFSKIFAGGEGIVYAIKDDGALVWYRHGGFADGGGMDTWSGPKTVGSGWGNFKDVFSEGSGVIYAIPPDGKLLRYQHTGYATGDFAWTGPRTIGSAWQQFRQVVPAGDGVLLAIRADGRLLWYRHRAPRAPDPGYKALGRVKIDSPSGPQMSLCDRARAARARNSPAAPGLEAQCRARGEVELSPNALSKAVVSGVYGTQQVERAEESDFRPGDYIIGGIGEGGIGEWQGPTEIGSGWQGFRKVVALLPYTPSGPR